MAKIFICYRRADSGGHAGRLYDRLVARFRKSRVYMDIDNIPLGSDFVEEIHKALNGCAAVIVLIGPQWFAGENRARLSMPGDHVRQEIAHALKSKAKVFPVLVHGARMPGETELPKDIQALARKHAIDLRDVSFDIDFQQLARALERLDGLKPSQAAKSKAASSKTRAERGKQSGADAGGARPAKAGKAARPPSAGRAAGGGTRQAGSTEPTSSATRNTRGATAAKSKQQPKSDARKAAKPPAPTTKPGGSSPPSKAAPAVPKQSRRKSPSASGGAAGGGARTAKGSGGRGGGGGGGGGRGGARKSGTPGKSRGGRGKS